MKISTLLRAALMCAALAAVPSGWAAFDPVNDDTDIFLANPQFAATRPNVLIFVDNTANWSQSSAGVTKYTGVRQGLKAVLTNVVNDNYNVGLAMFVETGSPNNSVDGGYLRFGIRRMTGTAADTNTNKGKLISMIDGLSENGDKGNGAVYSLAMAEMFKYFAGLTSTSGHGKEKADAGGSVYFASNRQTLGGSPLPANALPNVSAASAYTSPIVNECQKNFIIVISNGEANDNSSAIAAAEAMFKSDTGGTPTQIPLSPSGAEAIVADEYAGYMANGDCNPSLDGVQNVFTYTIDVLPKTDGGGPAHTALLQSMASNGKGDYYAINDISNTSEIETALRNIFQEVQAVNSVFASTTLPVSVNVRGTNLNQVYIGVFRPDANKSPRWVGNLKLYRLGVNTATEPDTLFLADATGADTLNPVTGFVSGSAQSFWTEDEAVDFWRFRDPSVNGVGGPSDLPDGDLVEKGGAAQQLRIAHSTAQSARNVYTCLNADADPSTCDGASMQLSSTPFNTANVSPADVGAYPTVGVISMSAAEDPGNLGTSIVTVSTGAAHGLGVGDTVRVEGASPNAFNGDHEVRTTGPLLTDFTYRILVVLPNNRARVNSTAHGMNSGDLVYIDTTPNSYDALPPGSAVTRTGEDTFEYVAASPPIMPHQGPFVTPSPRSRKLVSSLTAPPGTFTTARAIVTGHNYGPIGLDVFDPDVTITGANDAAFGSVATPCTPTQIKILTADSFEYTTCGTLNGTSDTAQASVSAHTFATGQSIRLRGTTETAYNGISFSITKIDNNTFTFPIVSGPDATGGVAGVLITSINQPNNNDTASVTTASAHGFDPGKSIRIAGTGGLFTNSGSCNGHDTGGDKVSWNVESAPTDTTFTIAARRQCASYSGTPAGAVAGFEITGIVPVISATGTIYSEKELSIGFITPLGTATGNVTVGDPTVTNAASEAARDQIVAWVRGADNSENENQDCTNSPFWPCSGTNFTPRTTDIRASIHGDVLHSRPAVVNYNRYGDDNDVYAFYGSNDGMLRALKGGTDFHASGPDASLKPGTERWALVVKEFFGKLKRLRNQFPTVSAATPKDYFFDGSIGVYQQDAKGNGSAATPLNCDPADTAGCSAATVSGVIGDNIHATKGDKVHIYLSMRRGGEFMYALDVTNPADPKLLWRKASGDPGWAELGQTWSEPQIARVKADLGNNNPNNPDNVVLIFGAGYDRAVEDLNPCLIESWSTTNVVRKAIGGGSVTYTASGTCTISGATGGTTTINRSRGRGILVVDAFSGEVVWQAGGTLTTSNVAGERKLNVPGMTCAIPSDTTVLDANRDSFADRIYVGDTCGQVWRVDIAAPVMDDWVVTQIASVSSGAAADIVNKRKFLFPPDIVFGTDDNNYKAVLMGTGDREHPFDANVLDAFYMFKDRDSADPGNPQAGAPNSTSVKISGFGTPPVGDPITHDSPLTTGVFDATSIEGANDRGWKIELGTGEKVVSSAVTISGSTFFNTNQPSATATTVQACSNLGIAREYVVGFADAAATLDLNRSGTVSIADRSIKHAGGGYLPSPVPVVVEIDGKRYQAVISGTSVQSPPGLTLEKRTRVYWYKEVE